MAQRGGVSDKTELTQGTEAEAKHSVGRDLQANASATFGIVTVSGQGKISTQDDDKTSRKDSLSHSIDLTNKSSSRAKKDYKTSFKVISTTTTEDASSQQIVNSSRSHSLRVDYYQLLKEWKVQLFRYDVRLAVDLVIPNPGAELFAPMAEVASLQAYLANGFQFGVAIDDVKPDTYKKIAASYGAVVDSPPPDGTPPQLPIIKTFVSDIGGPYTNSQDGDSADITRFATFDFEIDPGYQADSLFLENAFSSYGADITQAFGVLEDTFPLQGWVDLGPPNQSPYKSNLPFLVGATGKQTIVYYFRGASVGKVYLRVDQRPSKAAMDAWQLRTYGAIHDAAQALDTLNRQTANAALSKLQNDIANSDPLTLRELEREAVVKAILVWLFGPGFRFIPESLTKMLASQDPAKSLFQGKVLDPSLLNQQEWTFTIGVGDAIKFVNSAFDWEDLVYFVFPYFWGDRATWNEKRFLAHPDDIHRKFLRAGAARVILTVRPNFERQVTDFLAGIAVNPMNLGMDGYDELAADIQNYRTNEYPPPEAEPDGSVDFSDGKLVGQWTEYTPVEGLDIEAHEVLNTGKDPGDMPWWRVIANSLSGRR